ncbi:MAG: ankyrin repeat domain-containing protein, partial [Hyphomicrobiaceae bacterium]|nr:ankyrin repeat domain-containing protein [Hyphomicrobiaceae bacterium]
PWSRPTPEVLHRRMSRNEQGRLPLHHAVLTNRPTMVRLLLQLGADANALDLTGLAPISRVSTPAAKSGVVQTLLEAGGKLDLTGALRPGDYELTEAMLAKDPLRLVPGGRDAIALHLAIDRKDDAAVRWLIERGGHRCQTPSLRRQSYGTAHVR